MAQLKLIFMGTPHFAVPTLKALSEAGHEIAAVYSQPPRPAGRGYHLQKSSVHLFAEEKGFPVLTPHSLRTEEEQEHFSSFKADVAVVVAYGLILPKPVLEGTRFGCLNVHASLLPRWRGAAPIQRAIQAGDAKTGITIMKMEEGLDTGPILMKEERAITSETTGQSLHDELSSLGARLILPALEGYVKGALTPQPQSDIEMTYAPKVERGEGRIDWLKEAELLERTIRAFTPWPGTFFTLGEKAIKILKAERVEGEGLPGQVLDDQLTIACGRGALRLLEVQASGKKPMAIRDFLNGTPVPKGSFVS